MLLTSKYRFAAALSCAAALILTGCATPCQTMVEPGRYSLSKGVPVQVSPDTRLTLVSVEDSRCHDGVRCIWAGRIVYQLELSSCGHTERFQLTPEATGKASGPNPASHILAAAPALRVTLAPDATPPRGAGAVSPIQGVDVLVGHN